MYGRGRGRGRGRGGRSLGIAALRNELGDEAAADFEGPPPLYPEMDLPDVPDLTDQDKQLLAFWRNLGHFYKNSCYHLEHADATKGKVRDDPYGAMSKGKAQIARAPLSSVLTLDSHYFPEELFSTVEKRAAARAASSRAFLPAGGNAARDTGAEIFERFAKLEGGEGAAANGGRRTAGSGAEGREGAAGKEGGEEGDEEEQQLPEEEDDELQEDDDYLMGEAYDDDEGYDEDPYNDGDNEGPTY